MFAFRRAAGIKAAFGLSCLDKRRRTLGTAVDDAGFAVGYLGDMQGCDFGLTVRVPQPAPTARCARSPGTLDLTVSEDGRFAFTDNKYANPAPGVTVLKPS